MRSPRLQVVTATLFLALVVPGVALGQWVEFVDETATRLVADPAFGANDLAEKDYAWGDVDRDGDIDLVVVRKEIAVSAGKRINLLFLNEGGVLVDRTATFVSNSDVAGDQGFLTPTNDRDVQLADVNRDGWLDIITATTVSDGDPKAIGHPRVYRNLGNNLAGAWLGFRHEDGRIPTMLSASGGSGFNPRFCAVAAGDVTGDGIPELYFSDYDTSAFGPAQPDGADFNDRLLINDGNGNFFDSTALRFLGVVPGIGQPFEVSAFGAAAAIADMNGDGRNDIVKQTALQTPLYVGIAYNGDSGTGFFDDYQVVNQSAPYFMSVGDLNNDSKIDIVISDDGLDRYLLNQGNGPDGLAEFISYVFAFDSRNDDGFGDNSVVADLNGDGWNDVLIGGNDVDGPACFFGMHIYRNLGGQPGSQVVLQEQTSGTNCNSVDPSPDCLVAGIPASKLDGVHDIAVFDIDGDDRLDLVLGRCTGTEVYINTESADPTGLGFGYPTGLPLFIPPDESYTFQVEVTGFGGVSALPETVGVFVSIDGGEFVENPAVHLGGDLYDVTLPVGVDCSDKISYYVTAEATEGAGTFTDPSGGLSYSAIAAFGKEITLEEGFEGDTDSWTVVNDPGLASGGWEVAEPVGTFTGQGELSAPHTDAEAALDLVMAFVTQNGSPGQAVGFADVDGGPTDLISPAIDLSSNNATISYSRWAFSDDDDLLEVSVSNDGSVWVPVESAGPLANAWQVASFDVGDFVEPNSTVQIRFRISDAPNNSITEAGIDSFRVEKFLCQPPGSTAGRVPDGFALAGEPLRIDRGTADDLVLSWSDSCSATDSDYTIYEGTLGDFGGQQPLECSTGGATSRTITPATGSNFYLVVPTNGTSEGSYGADGAGLDRPAAGAACLPQAAGACG